MGAHLNVNAAVASTDWLESDPNRHAARQEKGVLVPALFGPLVKVHALDSIGLVAEEGAQRLAQPRTEHPREAGRMVQAAADEAAPIVWLARGIALDAEAAGVEVQHVGDKAVALVGGKAAADDRIAIALVLFAVPSGYFQFHRLLTPHLWVGN